MSLVMTLIAQAGGTLDHAVSGDFSFIALFAKAGWVVKGVMIMLIIASFISWVIAVNKFFYFFALKRRAKDFEETFWSGRTLEELNKGLGQNPQDPLGRVFAAAMREFEQSKQGPKRGAILGTQDRIDKVMNLVINREISRGERGMTILSIIASASVFVGLFGTVWGIMNAFRAIAAAESSSLIVIAPGLSEALFATALGLIAAIPALIFYNMFSNEIDQYAGRLEGYADELSAILSRKINKDS